MILMLHSVACNGEKELRILVMLPYRNGPFKLPFGAEMSGAAGEILFLLQCKLFAFRRPWGKYV